MTGKDHFEKMNKEEQLRFQKNMKYRFMPHCKKNFNKFISFLNEAFVWEKTPEGKQYWTEISEKYF